MADSAKPSAVLVEGIPSNIIDDTLENFFENQKRSGGGSIADMIYDKQERAALIQFEDKEVVERVLMKEPLELNGTRLQVRKAQPHEIKKLRVLWVVNLPDGISEDRLILFFESRKRCNGGDVEELHVMPSKRLAKVTFVEYNAAKRVLDHGQLLLTEEIVHVTRCIGELKDFTDTNIRKEYITLKLLQLKYLDAMKFSEKVTGMMPKLSIVINEEERFVEMVGLEGDIKKAQLKILKFLHPLDNQTKSVSSAEAKLLSTPEAYNHITSLLQANGILVVWTIDGNDMTLCASSKKKIDDAFQIIKSQICETKLEVPKHLMQTRAWEKYEERFKTKHRCVVVTKTNGNFVNVVFFKEMDESWLADVSNFLEDNIAITADIVGQQTAMKALTTVWNTTLQEIGQDHEVLICGDVEGNLQIEGRQEGVKEAEDKIKTLLKSIVIKEFELSCCDWLNSSVGKWVLQGLQKKLNVFIAENDYQEAHVVVTCGWSETDVAIASEKVKEFADAAVKQKSGEKKKEKSTD